ncbi:ADP-ribosylglycohydrolase family protein [Actinomadura scrupuli]|uniref:ADP-ribosylglycohydrolase family protein n=1 Tax=Actinomadura scrupuli TaxID=559629 RepID=UPI003D999E13
MNLVDRVRGCVLWGAIGDVLGAPIEFQSLERLRQTYGPDGVADLVWHESGRLGAITDDTQMTLFTIEGLIRSRGREVPAAVHAAHRRWYGTQMLSGPPEGGGPQRLATGDVVIMDGALAGRRWLYARRAPGNACLSGLRFGRMHTPDHPANPDSKGCGAVMRSAPFGLNPAWSPERAFDLAAVCGVQTHGHPSGHLAAGAFAAITRHLLDDLDLEEAVRRVLDHLGSRDGGRETHDALRTALQAAEEGTPSAERLEELGAGWVAEEALAMSVYCALVHPGDIRAALLLAVNHSGDSDSTGAITGNLLGVRHGEAGIPEAWALALEGRETMLGLADDFVRAVTDGHPEDPAWLERYPPQST